jgi:hypothetical protein
MKRSATLLLLTAFIISTTSFGFEVIVVSGTSPAGPAKHWNRSQFPVGYSIHNQGTNGISASAVSTQYNKVITIINKQSPLKFQNLGTTTSVVAGDRKNGVIFDKNFQYGSFALAVQRLGSTSSAPLEFTEGDLVFNDKDYNFTVNATNLNNQTYNLFTVMLHEMGHATGLNHSQLTSAVMFFQYQKDVIALGTDDRAGIKYIYRNPAAGTLPKLITPINNGIHALSKIVSTSRVITFRWYKSQFATRLMEPQVVTTFSLVFAGDSAFTKSVKRYDASSQTSYLIKGTKLTTLKNIQAASPTGEIFWRVEEKNGTQVLKSTTFRFKIA